MGDQDGTEGLDREAAKHYRLGNLLRKERSELKARLVQSVVHDSLPIEEKISRINAIDLKPEDEAAVADATHHRPARIAKALSHIKVVDRNAKPSDPTQALDAPIGLAEKPVTQPLQATPVPAPGSAKPVATPLDLRDPHLALTSNERRQLKARFSSEARLPHPAMQQASRNRLRNVQEPEHGGFLRFFLSEYRKIRRFGADTNTLEPSGWPFSLRFSPAVPVFIEKTLKQGVLDTLGQALPQILRKGWMFMDRLEYNLLAMLQSLVAAGRKLEYRESKSGGEPVSGSFTQLLSYLLVFQSGEGLVARVTKIFLHAGERTGVEEAVRNEGRQAIRTLLDPLPSGLTVPNLVRAIWMRRSHRFLILQDLGSTGTIQRYLSDAAFDCPADVQLEIDRHLSQLLSRLDNLDLERLEIERWRAFMPAPLDPRPGEPPALVDWTPLNYFYSGQAAGENFDLDLDRTIPLLQTVRFLDRYLKWFEPLLVSGVRLANEPKAEILQRGLFSTQITKLGFLHERLQELVIAMPHLGQSRFADLVAGISGSDQEKQVTIRVQELAAVLTGLGKAIADIIRNRSALADLAIRGGQGEPPAYPLPNEGEKLLSPEGLAGKTVLAGLVEAASLALLQGMLLVPGEMAALLGRELELKKQLEPIRESLERLASPEQWQEVLAAYPRLLAKPASAGAPKLPDGGAGP